MRSRRALLGWLLFGLGCTLLLALGLLHTSPVRRYALKRAAQSLRDEFGVELRAARFDYNLLSFRASLQDATIRAAAASDLPPLLEAETVSADLRPWDLLRGQYSLDAARIEKLSLRVVRDRNGRTNIPETPARESKTTFPEFLIRNFEITGGTFRLEDQVLQLAGSLDGWELRIAGDDRTLNHEIRLRAERGGELAFHNRSLRLSNLEFAGILSRTALHVSRLSLEAEKTRISISGTVDDFRSPSLDLRLQSNLDIGRLAAFLDLPDEPEGAVTAEVQVSGNWNSLQGSGRLEGRGLSVAGYANLALQAQGRWEGKTGVVRVEPFTVSMPRGSVQGSAQLGLDSSRSHSSLDAELLDLDTRPLFTLLELPFQVFSRVSGNVRASWQGTDLSGLRSEGRVRLVQGRAAPARNVLPLSGSLRWSTAGRSAQISISSADLLATQLRGQVSIGASGNLTGSVNAAVGRIEELLAGLRAFLGRDDLFAVEPVAGAADLGISIAGTLERPVLSAAVAGSALELGPVKGARLQAIAELLPDRLRIPDARVDWADQSLHASGEVRFGQPDTSFDFTAGIEQGSVARALERMESKIPADGRFRVDARLSGTLGRPEGRITLSAEELSLYGEPLGELSGEATLAGGLVELRRLRLEKPLPDGRTGHIEARGSYLLEADRYEFEAEARDFKLADIRPRDDLPVSAGLHFSARGAGTLQDPALELDLRLEEMMLSGRNLGTVTARAGLKQQRAEIAAAIPRFQLSSRSTIDINAPYRAWIEISAEKTDLSAFGIKLDDARRVEGEFTGVLEASGDLQNWEQGQAAAVIQDLAAGTGELQIRNDGPVSILFQDSSLHIKPATLRAGEASIFIEGNLPLENRPEPAEVRVAAHLDLARTAALFPPEKEIFADGRLDLSASIRGSLADLKPAVTVDLVDGFLMSPVLLGKPLSDVAARAELRNGAVVVDYARGEWAGGTFRATADLPLGLLIDDLPLAIESREGAARFSLELKNVSADAFRRLPADVGGTLALRLEGSAPKLELGSLQASAQFDDLRLRVAEYALNQAEPVRISLREGRAEIESMTLVGPKTRIHASGSADLTGDLPLRVELQGNADSGLLTFMSDNFKVTGDSRFRLNIGGRFDSPEISGFLEMPAGGFTLRTPRVQAENLDVRIDFLRDRATISRFSGTLNGGTLEAGGAAVFAGTGLEDFQVDASIANAYLNFPEGFRTSVSADLRLRPRDDLVMIGGTARIHEGSYRDPVELEGQVLRYLRTARTGGLAETRDPFLSKIRYDIALQTEGPVVVDNNLAKVALDGNVRLVGTYYRPAVTGRVGLEEGGEIYFNERKYLVERGTIDFISQSQIQPSVDILARTQVNKYDIELQLDGSTDKFSTRLSSPSHPDLSEPDLVSLLLTGRTLEDFRGAELNVARQQVLSYLSGRIGSRISRGAEQSLGLSEVRIEPNLISGESDPSARLTFGRDITRDLRLVYSMDLSDSQNQIWIAEYDFARRFNTRGIKQEDNSYRYEFLHDLRFGGSPGTGGGRPGSEQRKLTIGKIRFEGDTVLPENQVADVLKLKEGDRFDFFKLQQRADRLQSFYANRGFAESQIRLDRLVKDRDVELSVRVQAGPEVSFVFDGYPVSEKLLRDVRENWNRGVFDAQRIEEAVQILRRKLVEEGYLEARVGHSIEEPSDSIKRVLFEIDPGARYRSVPVEFEGNAGIASETLETQLEAAGLVPRVHTQPEEVVEYVRRIYVQQGFPDAEVRAPRPELDPRTRTGRVVIPIVEGPLVRVGRLVFEGNRDLPESDLRLALPTLAESPAESAALEAALSRLEELYWSKGYNDVSVNYQQRRAGPDQMEVLFNIAENKQGIVKEIVVEGNRRTSVQFVRGQLEISAGEILDFEKINRSRKRLYDTGAYSMVDLETEAAEPDAPGPSAGTKEVRVRVRLREIQPYGIRYGGFYDTDRGPGLIAEAARRNFLGGARILGLKTRYDGDVREIRGYFSQPFFRDLPLKSDTSVFFRRELREAFISDRLGFSLQQETRLKSQFIFSYGYRFERNHTFEKDPNPIFPFDIQISVARLTGTVTREVRDDLLDPTRGSFTSHAFEFAPESLGSEIRFLKYFGQYFHYVPLSAPAEVPFGGGLKKPRWVYAGALRVGLARALGGQELIPSERFFAGGGTTLRGFDQDRVGPLDFFGDPAGGNAVFIANQEIRFPALGPFDGVGFLDLGNVYASASDFNPFKVRKSAGLGIRVRTPFLLLRFDYGFKLDRRAGESRGDFFFSIGQAF